MVNSREKEFLEIGTSSWEGEDFKEAIRNFNKVIKLNPKNIEALWKRGSCYGSLTRENFQNYSDFEENAKNCLHDYNLALELNPNCEEASFLKFNDIRSINTLRDLHASLKYYGDLIEKKINSAEAYLKRGIIKENRNLRDIQGALEDYSKAIEINPIFKEAYKKRGLLNKIWNPQSDESFKDLQKAISIDETDPEIHFELGVLFYWKGISEGDELLNAHKFFKIALRYFNNSIELFSRYDKAFVYRGKTFKELNEYDNAIADYTTAIELNPTGKRTSYQVAGWMEEKADIMLKNKEYKDAIEIYKSLVRNNRLQNIPPILQNKLIFALIQNNNNEEAIKILEEKSSGLEWLDDETYFLLGLVKINLNDFKNAELCFRKIIKSENNFYNLLDGKADFTSVSESAIKQIKNLSTRNKK